MRSAKARILVVDDDEMLRNVIRAVLMQGGYEVVVARHGEDAVFRHQEDGARFDLVLMDLQMPKMDGREAVRRMREEEPGLNALFLSGALAGDGMEDVDFLLKPFENHELLRKVGEMLDRGVAAG